MQPNDAPSGEASAPDNTKDWHATFVQNRLMVCTECTITPFALSGPDPPTACRACGGQPRFLSEKEINAGQLGVYAFFCCHRCQSHSVIHAYKQKSKHKCNVCGCTSGPPCFQMPYGVMNAWIAVGRDCHQQYTDRCFASEVDTMVAKLETHHGSDVAALAQYEGSISAKLGPTENPVKIAALRAFVTRHSKEKPERAWRVFLARCKEAADNTEPLIVTCDYCAAETEFHESEALWCRRDQSNPHSAGACSRCIEISKSVPLHRRGCLKCRVTA